MDNWIEVNVAVTHEAVEVVSEILTEAGSKGVAIEDPQLINDLRNSCAIFRSSKILRL